MKVRNARIAGDFQSASDPRDPADREHRISVNDIWVRWEWRSDGGEAWRAESLMIPGGKRYDGASRPEFTGWLIPRWGVNSAASLVHDYCFENRPFLSNGERISRQHTDLLFLGLMRELAADRVTTGWKAPAQLAMAEAMYRTVRYFGESTWDKHDSEHRTEVT